jgi:hypothetical protein
LFRRTAKEDQKEEEANVPPTTTTTPFWMFKLYLVCLVLPFLTIRSAPTQISPVNYQTLYEGGEDIDVLLRHEQRHSSLNSWWHFGVTRPHNSSEMCEHGSIFKTFNKSCIDAGYPTNCSEVVFSLILPMRPGRYSLRLTTGNISCLALDKAAILSQFDIIIAGSYSTLVCTTDSYQ